MWKKVDGRWCDAYVENGKWVYQPVSFAAVYQYEPDGDRPCFDICIDDDGVVDSVLTMEDAERYLDAHGFHNRAYADQEDDWSDPVNRYMLADDGECVEVWYQEVCGL